MIKKGIILELREKEAVIINDLCEYETIPRIDGMFEGQLIEYTIHKKNRISRQIIALVSAAAIIIILFAGYFRFFYSANPQVFAYIDLDINPSMEFLIDRNNTVIDLKSLNSDAEGIINSTNVKGKNLKEAVSNVLKELHEKGYLKPEASNLILLSASYPDKTELIKNNNDKNALKLNETIANIKLAIEKNENKNVSVKVIYVKPDLRKASIDHNMSMGRYALYSKAVGLGVNISPQYAKTAKLNELIPYISPDIQHPDALGKNEQTDSNTSNNLRSDTNNGIKVLQPESSKKTIYVPNIILPLSAEQKGTDYSGQSIPFDLTKQNLEEENKVPPMENSAIAQTIPSEATSQETPKPAIKEVQTVSPVSNHFGKPPLLNLPPTGPLIEPRSTLPKSVVPVHSIGKLPTLDNPLPALPVESCIPSANQEIHTPGIDKPPVSEVPQPIPHTEPDIAPTMPGTSQHGIDKPPVSEVPQPIPHAEPDIAPTMPETPQHDIDKPPVSGVSQPIPHAEPDIAPTMPEKPQHGLDKPPVSEVSQPIPHTDLGIVPPVPGVPEHDIGKPPALEVPQPIPHAEPDILPPKPVIPVNDMDKPPVLEGPQPIPHAEPGIVPPIPVIPEHATNKPPILNAPQPEHPPDPNINLQKSH